ncbi:MAG: hypothetical protein WCG42_08105, partial [Parachlamydiaceae bacterium]
MKFCSNLILFLLSYLLFLGTYSEATVYTVSSTADDGTSGTLRYALLNAVAGDTVSFSSGLNGTITIGSSSTYQTALPYLTGVTILGNGNTISGTSTYPVFFAYSGSSTISNLNLQNGLGRGGVGGVGSGGGGGGLGAGGALFICPGATVTTSNVAFSTNSVIGGNGGNGTSGNSMGGGGGGGLYS